VASDSDAIRLALWLLAGARRVTVETGAAMETDDERNRAREC
jgi:hypothetical protein